MLCTSKHAQDMCRLSGIQVASTPVLILPVANLGFINPQAPLHVVNLGIRVY